MPLAIYMAPKIGNGSALPLDPADWTETTGPYRSLVFDYLHAGRSGNHSCIDNPIRHVHLTFVEAAGTRMDAIEADTRVERITPSRADDRDDLKRIMNAPLESFPALWRVSVNALLETQGVNVEWVTGKHPFRDVLGHAVKMFAVCQIAESRKILEIRDLLAQNLDMPVSNLAAKQYAEMVKWLSSKRISVLRDDGSLKVRQIVASFPSAFEKLYGRETIHRFAGEEFA